MTWKRSLLPILAFLVSAHPAQAQPIPLDAAFETWLAAINAGDEAAVLAWYDRHLGIPEALFALDIAEDTCGFDLVRIEARTTETLRVLLAERCFPALQRLTLQSAVGGDGKLAKYDLASLALTHKGATAAIAAMADRLAERDAFAGSLLIVHRGEPLLARSWGQLDKAGSAPLSLDTPVFYGSAGKMFTAVAVLQLVEAGRIDLDAPLGQYLPDCPNADMARVTIRQLLQHRGGTGDSHILARDEAANRARVRSIDDIIALNGDRPPAFAPGSRAEYSNFGFELLGAVVERVSGISYYDYVATHVFEPAGMEHAGFPERDRLDGVGMGYTTYFGEEPALVPARDILPWRGTPAGGGVASANDMLRFIEALRSGKLLSAPMLRSATTAGETPWYGMGFFVLRGEGVAWGHGGSSYGMSAAAWFYPDSETTFVCTATRDRACDRLMNPWHTRVFGPTE